MKTIIPGITTLYQHFVQIEQNPASYKPSNCPHCEQAPLWNHGTFPRKADRVNNRQHSLNPILIPRFYCKHCQQTCSVLPECIPPRRWFVWEIQQAVILFVLFGNNISKASKKYLPSRWTIKRWIKKLKNDFQEHCVHLKSYCPWLGQWSQFTDFWQQVIARIGLSKAMLILNQAGVNIS